MTMKARPIQCAGDILRSGAGEDTSRAQRYNPWARAAASDGYLDPDEVGRVVQAVEAELGTIDILINTAAVMDNLGKFDEQQPGVARYQRQNCRRV